jgi:hypothetical protein
MGKSQHKGRRNYLPTYLSNICVTCSQRRYAKRHYSGRIRNPLAAAGGSAALHGVEGQTDKCERDPTKSWRQDRCLETRKLGEGPRRGVDRPSGTDAERLRQWQSSHCPYAQVKEQVIKSILNDNVLTTGEQPDGTTLLQPPEKLYLK